MTPDPHKRLEEAALKISCNCPPVGRFGTGNYEPAELDEDAYNAALKGAEFGYKEAIEVAKEWLYEHGKLDKLDLVEFDMQLNKLLED